MPAIDRTRKRFVRALQEAVPDAKFWLSGSNTEHGRSIYIYIADPKRVRPWKVRISDHPVGMRRALWGDEDLFLAANATLDNYCIWLGGLAAHFKRQKAETDGQAGVLR